MHPEQALVLPEFVDLGVLSEEENAPGKPKKPVFIKTWNHEFNRGVYRTSKDYLSFASFRAMHRTGDNFDAYKLTEEFTRVNFLFHLAVSEWKLEVRRWEIAYPKKNRNDRLRRRFERESLNRIRHRNLVFDDRPDCVAAGFIKVPIAGGDLTSVDDYKRCIICLENEARCIALPCGHFNFCVNCSRTMVLGTNHLVSPVYQHNFDSCPKCRGVVKEFKLVHI